MGRRPAARLSPLLAAALALAGCGDTGASRGAGERPSFLFLLTDDQAHDALSAAGNTLARTPSIDHLAETGVRFTNAFVTTSLCSPARASFLTGVYARVHGVLNNEAPLDPALPNVASELRAAGYDTAWFGKWHLGEIHEGRLPGFDRAVGYRAQGKYRDCLFYVDGEELPTRGFVDDVTTDLAIEYLREGRSRPFFLGLGYKAPHGPRFPDRRFKDMFADAVFEDPPNLACLPPYPRQAEWNGLAGGDPAWRPSEDWRASFGERSVAADYESDKGDAMRDYLRLIAGIDESVGRLLAALDELDLARSTVVVFASDNGYGNGQHGMGGKRSAYEESLRIALIVRDPRAGGGRLADELALNIDLAPTLLELAGLDVPAGMQGRSLVPALRGLPGSGREDFLYEYVREDGYSVPDILALRGRRWKLVTYPGYPGWTELFDLERDPYETRNLAPDEPARVAELSARLAELDATLGPRPGR